MRMNSNGEMSVRVQCTPEPDPLVERGDGWTGRARCRISRLLHHLHEIGARLGRRAPISARQTVVRVDFSPILAASSGCAPAPHSPPGAPAALRGRGSG